ncbi:hypothetical protein [Bdellovibrio sp. NC01]|uniref:hypothetical protein n=1 Tax=Bdellovibrio sp. NC01 TaxID=2220073 RepID=UPI00115B2515|nr:hypothetical protein [Bdellovibrio sp. NC01]QDK36846.1 hypothetical protein DOE51_04170 [Bdellovibrio sp. NC01]
MKSLLFALSIAGIGSLASAAGNTVTFSDNTKVEVLALPTGTGIPTSTSVVQIKQADGTVCYSITQSGNSASFPNSISCIKP